MDPGSTPGTSTKLVISCKLLKRPLINNQIRAEKVRVIDENGNNLGLLDLREALPMAWKRNLDLIQVTEKTDPPVCRIMDYGKYLYSLQKKERAARVKKGGELKGIRLSFNISTHDLETRARQAEKFLKRGDKVRVEMVLRGREKGLQNFAQEKINQFLEILGKLIPIKIEGELKKGTRGFIMIISKA